MFDDLAKLVGVMELLYDVGDLVWSLTGYGTHEHVFGLIKKALKKPLDPHTRWFNGIEYMKMIWEFGVLEPLGMALGQKEDEGTHTHMIVIGHLDTYYTLDVDAIMDTL